MVVDKARGRGEAWWFRIPPCRKTQGPVSRTLAFLSSWSRQTEFDLTDPLPVDTEVVPLRP